MPKPRIGATPMSGKLGAAPGWANNVPPHPQHQPGALLHGRTLGRRGRQPGPLARGSTVAG